MTKKTTPALQLSLFMGAEGEKPPLMPPPLLASEVASPAAAPLPTPCVSLTEPASPTIYGVGELTQLLSLAWKQHPVLGQKLLVQGEVSNLKRSSRGHIYFTLKEATASISCVMWASTAGRLAFTMEEGMALIATATLDIYAPSGNYSLVCSKVEPQGVGGLQLAYQQLKAKLEAEGLFESRRKRPLPACPFRIGIITSPTGSVLQDMLRTIRAKNAVVEVILAPAVVQGDAAAASIVAAIEALQDPRLNLEALILARGGGSFEDLFCFSDEAVVRAVAACRLPIVTGIGHEPDFSLADAAADYSAQTPTGAADALLPDVASLQAFLQQQEDALVQQVGQRLLLANRQVDALADQLGQGLPTLLQAKRHQVQQLQTQLAQGATQRWQATQQAFHLQLQALEAYNPLATLARGYSVVECQGQVVRDASEVAAGQRLTLRFERSHCDAIIC